MTRYVIETPLTVALSVKGTNTEFPVRRVCFIGHICAAHVVQMGRSVDDLECARDDL